MDGGGGGYGSQGGLPSQPAGGRQEPSLSSVGSLRALNNPSATVQESRAAVGHAGVRGGTGGTGRAAPAALQSGPLAAASGGQGM